MSGFGLLGLLALAAFLASATTNPVGTKDPSIIHLTDAERNAILQILSSQLKTASENSDDLSSSSRLLRQEPLVTVMEDPESDMENYGKQKRQGRDGSNVPFLTEQPVDAWRTALETQQGDAKSNIVPKTTAWKRKVGGKLCYINPIACFGRRQREAVK